MESTATLTVHTVADVRKRADIRRLATALREPGVHLLTVAGAVQLPADVLALAEAVRDAAVVTCASGRVEGAALAVFAAGSLRLATPGAELAWGRVVAVPGLAAVLATADPAVPGRLAWGEVVEVEELAGGLVHRVVADPVAEVEANVVRSGGAAALGLRLRSLTAAREAGSWAVAARFDRHLALAEAGA